ncbi:MULTISPECIES: MFS transporter [unclassified Roseateles]|uniref:MFS transporter n=1 Tax=unclassified Roseateles TaxID=2626991 RepID=UPI0006F53FAD|nr:MULTISPECIES: MFS transporter [unclassified Roseateles]KQW51191.1 hypothetical protein ASC81_00600 [Pelomonas sp. Root405]KRA77422.1 hypothetical protein ASD88_00600 [Pelomonas sp. Root662]
MLPLTKPHGHPARAIALLAAMVFVVSLAYGAAQPLLQPTLLRHLGPVSAEEISRQVGWLGGAYLFALFTFALVWGRLSDRIGRVPVLMLGFGLFLVGTALTALATQIGWIYATRLLAGAGAAAIVPTAQAYIADISTPVVRSRRFVVLGTMAFIGLITGPAFGTWLAGPVMREPVGQMAQMLHWPAWAIAAFGTVLLALTPWALGSERARSAQPCSDPEKSRSLIRSSMLLAFLASVAVGTFDVGFNLFGSQTLGMNSSAIAAMFATCSLVMLTAQLSLLFAAVRRRLNERWLAATFAASALALLFTPSDARALGLMVAVVALGAGMIAPVLSYTLLNNRPGAPGLLLGQLAAAGNLGQAVGAVGAGSAFALNATAPFWIAASVLIVGACVSWFAWRPQVSGDDLEVGTGENR